MLYGLVGIFQSRGTEIRGILGEGMLCPAEMDTADRPPAHWNQEQLFQHTTLYERKCWVFLQNLYS
jgi:hypothetical protein